MAKTLDRSRPFGTITGEHFGAAYEQDGCCFDAQGQHVPEADPKPATKATTAPVPRATTAPPPIPLTAAEQSVDLVAWRKGEVKYPWHLVVNAIEAKYSERPRNIPHAYEIIDAEPSSASVVRGQSIPDDRDDPLY